MIKLRQTIVILELHQQGLTVSAISRETGLDLETQILRPDDVRKSTDCGGTAAAILSLIETAELNGLDQQSYCEMFLPASQIIPQTRS